MRQISKLNFNNLESFFSKASVLEPCLFNWAGKEHRFHILREDLLHPALSGNKFRKLFGWLQHYRLGNFTGIESMGGAHSNHLSALAYACVVLQIPCTVFVPVGSKSPLLDKIQSTHIQIQEVTREKFRVLREKPTSDMASTLWIPEGGKGDRSREGFASVAEQLVEHDFECFVSAGTGSTALALASYGVKTNALLAVKDKSVQQKLSKEGVTVFPSFEISKFGKLHSEALLLAKVFCEQTGILLDPVYQAKGLLLLCNERLLNEKSVFIHTGGVQGWMGYQNEFDINFPERIKKEVYHNFDAIFTA